MEAAAPGGGGHENDHQAPSAFGAEGVKLSPIAYSKPKSCCLNKRAEDKSVGKVGKGRTIKLNNQLWTAQSGEKK